MTREEQIHRFLNGEMSPKERLQFEKMLGKDEKLLAEVFSMRVAVERIVAEGNRKKLFLKEV